MKYLILFTLFLTGCFPSTNCPPMDYSGFQYGDRVMIKGGFYDGQVGTIRAQRAMYNFDKCSDAGFEVKLDNGGEEVTIIRSQLSKRTAVLKCKAGAHPFCRLPK